VRVTGTVRIMDLTVAARRPSLAAPVVPPVKDVLLATGAAALTLGQSAHGGLARLQLGSTGPYDAAWAEPGPLALALGATVPLVWWRRSPLAVFVVTALSSAALVGFDRTVDVAVGPAVALFLVALARDGSTATSRRAAAVAAACGSTYVAAATVGQGRASVYLVLHSSLAVGAGWFAGERTRLRREHLATLRDRADRAEREREQAHRLAVAEERARIARDLHDSAGHAISTIAVRAGAARLRHADEPERSLAALAQIEDLARATAEEMDRIVGVLRADDTSQPRRGTTEIPALVDQHRDDGLSLDVTLDHAALGDLDGTVGEAAYWIVHEALANAGRHGCGRGVLRIAGTDADFEIEVTNPVADDEPPRRPAGGHGIIGMRERAELVGGTVEAGRCGSAYVVRARLPARTRP
jgi:signal transduction histidine kinase